jgi:hypothetical protein
LTWFVVENETATDRRNQRNAELLHALHYATGRDADEIEIGDHADQCFPQVAPTDWLGGRIVPGAIGL